MPTVVPVPNPEITSQMVDENKNQGIITVAMIRLEEGGLDSKATTSKATTSKGPGLADRASFHVGDQLQVRRVDGHIEGVDGARRAHARE